MLQGYGQDEAHLCTFVSPVKSSLCPVWLEMPLITIETKKKYLKESSENN